MGLFDGLFDGLGELMNNIGEAVIGVERFCVRGIVILQLTT